MPSDNYRPRRYNGRTTGHGVLILILCVVLLLAVLGWFLHSRGGQTGADVPETPSVSPTASESPAASESETPPPSDLPEPSASETASPEPTEPPEPTQPAVPFDFSLPAPETEAVDPDYFADAVFIGDSRTDGLRLYGGIENTHFLSSKSNTVFTANDKNKQVLDIGGKQYSYREALARKSYGKVYIALGVNELGYEDSSYRTTFSAFLDHVLELQPDAVIYLQQVVPVNPAKCKEYHQASYVTNRKVAAFNEILRELAAEKKVVFLSIGECLTTADGILDPERTVDGVHFTKPGYRDWAAYLAAHTVRAEDYRAGRELENEEGEPK